jgi:endonuclease YncB( thermonuclease family)
MFARMSRHWPPRKTRWLTPDAYDALSAAEKRALWSERQRQRTSRHSQSRPSTISGTTVGVVVAIAVCIGLAAGLDQRSVIARVSDAIISGLPRASGARNDSPVTTSFGTCKWGGGTNCVVDGDTFYVNGDKVRIAGIDAPETHDYRCESELALGNRATEKLRELLNSGGVTMTSIDRDRDIYGRLLRNVQVEGQDVGDAMIAAGVARNYEGGRRSWCS